MKQKLLKSTSIVSFMTFISRIFGLIRDTVITTCFGAVAGLDAFWVAFKIPNFMRRLFAEGAFSQAFVPVLSDFEGQKEDQEVKALLNNTFGCLASVLFLITLIGIVAAPWIIMAFAPGFDINGARYEFACEMLRWTFPYLFFISLTAFFGAIQNVNHRFAIPAVTPVLLNASLIFSAMFLSKYLTVPVGALAYGVLIAGIVQFLFQIPFLYKLNRLPKLSFNWRHPGVKRILLLMGPAILGASVMQINLLVDTWFASHLPEGSLTWLYLSDRVLEFPIGIFGIALATVALPHLSTQFSQNNLDGFNASIDWALRWIALIGVPAMLGLILLAGPILTTLFQYKKFEPYDIYMTRMSLAALGSGLVAYLSVKVLVSAFFARKDTKFPMKVAIIALCTNIILNILLIKPMQHAGLALASALSSILQFIILLVQLKKLGVFSPLTGWRVLFLKLSLANLVMVWCLVWLTPELSFWFDWGAARRVIHLSGIVLAAGLCYLCVLFMVGLKPVHLQLRDT